MLNSKAVYYLWIIISIQNVNLSQGEHRITNQETIQPVNDKFPLMMWFNCHDTAAFNPMLSNNKPIQPGTLMVNDYVLLVTRGRGGRGTHNQIYPGKVHRENMDTKHHQATHGNHSLYHSEDRRQIRKNIFHTCLFSPTSRNSVSCLHVWQKWFLQLEYIGICVDVISQHIWGLFERKEWIWIQIILNVTQKIKPLWMWFWSSSVKISSCFRLFFFIFL